MITEAFDNSEAIIRPKDFMGRKGSCVISVLLFFQSRYLTIY